jgi:hypothetical protein
VTRYQPTPQEQAQRKKQALAERVEKQSRVRILDAIRKKLPDLTSRPDLEMVALGYFRRLGHDNHRRLCKVYGWEEKKSKAHEVAKQWTTRRSRRQHCKPWLPQTSIVFSSFALLSRTFIAFPARMVFR